MGKKGKGKENLDRNMAQGGANGPSLFKFLNNKYLKKYKFEGIDQRLDAFKEDSLVFAPMKDGTYQIAKIIACRIIRDLPDDVSRENGGDLEYYVHFEGYNRRIDRWVKHNCIVQVKLFLKAYF